MKDFYTYFFNEVTSTMDVAKDLSQKHSSEPTIIAVVAQKQTSGRGRAKSVWVQGKSEPQQMEIKDDGVYENFPDAISAQEDFLPVTLIFPASRLKVPLEWVTTLISVALYDALETTESFLRTHFPLLPFSDQKKRNRVLKWPNDIITYPDKDFSYQKICGVLCESSLEKLKPHYFFIGIGLNFFCHPELNTATSFWQNLFSTELNKEQKKELNKWLKNPSYKKETLKRFSSALMKELSQYLCVSKTTEQLKHFVLERSLPIGTLLSVNKGTVRGEYLGVNEHAALLLKGHTEPIYSGDITLLEKLTHELYSQPVSQSSEGPQIMSQATLAADFGNTRLHLGFQSSRGVKCMTDITYDIFSNNNIRELRNAFKPILEELIVDKNKKIDFIYISVITSALTIEFTKKIKDFLNSLLPDLSFLERKVTETEIFQCTDIGGDFEKDRLGADRAMKFLFAAEAAQKEKQNVLVFSFGTAVTCEGVSYKETKTGQTPLAILENFIFPGVQMAMNALNHYTALVPLFKADVNLFSANGKTWDQEIYIQRGVFFSVASSVLTAIKVHSPCKCYLGGGNALTIKKIICDLAPEEDLNIEILPFLEIHMLLDHKEALIAALKKN